MATKLTDEQKKKFGPMLQQTYCAIASDAEELLPKRGRISVIVELTCDANRPEMFGGMSKEDYKILWESYSHRDTQKWLREILNY